KPIAPARRRSGVYIPILTLGSYGDVRPYLALARGLRAAGHDAVLLGPDHFAEYAAPADVPFTGLGAYPDSQIRLALQEMAAEPNELLHPRIVVRHNKDQLASAERAIALTRDADVIVSHNIAIAGFLAARVNAKPLVTAHLFPSLIPSSQSTPNGT